jgi:putative transposase
VIVKPETLIGWHRKGFKLFWWWKSQAGRPRLPENIRKLIVRMAQENPTWGQARVAAELSVKLGIYVSPLTVRAYWPPEPDQRGPRRTSSQHWRTFVRNQAQSIVACDFLVVVTARFRPLYVLLLMEVGTRRIVHCNVTAHPTAEWTLQQFREAIPSDHSYRFVIHDGDSIFTAEVDGQLKAFGLSVLRTPARAPQANGYCERLVGKSPYAHASVDPNRTTQFLVAMLAGLQVPFICSETHELAEELVGSYLHQVLLYHWLESNDHGRFLADNDL